MYVGLLVLEKFPITVIIAGLISNGLYFLLLKDFPFIELTSPVFLGGVGKSLVVYQGAKWYSSYHVSIHY